MNEFHIIAHRGTTMRVPETTLSAFTASAQLGVLCPYVTKDTHEAVCRVLQIVNETHT